MSNHAPTPVPSEVAETTAGEREVEALAWQMLAGVRCQAVHQQIAGAWCVNCESWARTVGEPFWRVSFAALLDRVRREEGERIAQAIEADRPEMGLHINVTEYRRGMDDGLTKAARIARAASVGRGEGL